MFSHRRKRGRGVDTDAAADTAASSSSSNGSNSTSINSSGGASNATATTSGAGGGAGGGAGASGGQRVVSLSLAAAAPHTHASGSAWTAVAASRQALHRGSGSVKRQRLAATHLPFTTAESDSGVGDIAPEPHLVASATPQLLEDSLTKSKRLQASGCTLAEAERFGQALGMFDQAIELTPKRRELHELKAQALLALAQDFRAVQVRRDSRWLPALRGQQTDEGLVLPQAATQATVLSPDWAPGWLTLGRARLNFGEGAMAVASLEKVQQQQHHV